MTDRTFIERLMDNGIEPDLNILTAIVGPEEAQKKLDEWRFASLARRAGDDGTGTL